ncbi:hypothetical protein CMUS01_05637 [Colletotrichum musicola]|uniref:Uncharacterized protein n=1 Tax=Colletotrichum musicola TaxID=2175873 RepID=A0A8H6KRZ2_9PEZI|nr:hypothetical protein CMUS01_05637 [Colletotrichum musicola]
MSDSSTNPMKETVTGGKMVLETTPTAQNLASATTKIADEYTSEVATEVAIKPAKEAQVEVKDEDTKNLATASATMLKTGEFMKSLMAQYVACDSMNETGHIETERTIVFKPTVDPITESEPMEEVLPSEDKAEATMTGPPETGIPAPTHASKSPAKNEGNTPSWEDTLLQLGSIKAVDLLEEERDILRAFACGMQPATQDSSEKAARAINVLCPPLGQDNEKVADWVWMCWEVMFNIVQSPDVASGVLDRLVSIIESLHRRARGNVKIDGPDPTTGYMQFTEEAAQAWQNMNSFAARCLAGSIGGPFNQAMYALRLALEEELSSTPEITVCRMKVACSWITYASKPMLRWALENAGRTDVSPDDDAAYVKRGPLYHGPPTMCLQRWGYWINRFNELGKDAAGAGEEAQKLALEAAKTMKQVEAQLGNRV